MGRAGGSTTPTTRSEETDIHWTLSPRSASQRSVSPAFTGRSTKNKIPRNENVNQHPPFRELIRSELREFLVCEQFQKVLQDQVALALDSSGCAPQSGVLGRVEAMLDRLERSQPPLDALATAELTSLSCSRVVGTSVNEGNGEVSVQLHTKYENEAEDIDAEIDHDDKANFDRKVKRASTSTSVAVVEEVVGAGSSLQNMRDRWYVWWERLEEPRRTGCLARTMRSHMNEIFMCAVVITDVCLMIYETDRSVSQAGSSCDVCAAGDLLFQFIYTIELMLKLIVHGRWFFCNDSMAQNWFDFFLVVSGLIDFILVESGAGGSSLRIIRLARLGKALRALKVMSRIKHLQVFIVCISGSISPFFWAMVMLMLLFVMFSLFFVKLLASQLETNMFMSDDMEAMFGSVEKSMLTLLMASTGGEDWAVAYQVISDVGVLGSVCYLIFIAFVQLALVNIITGIFVDAAMQTLAPTAEVVARSRNEQEAEYARELERLCRLVDNDECGTLSKDTFEEGMRKGRIPMLLTMLGLRREHVSDLFNEMLELSKEDQGQVDIAKFVSCCMQLKGPATHYDLQKVLSKLETMQRHQSQMKRWTQKMSFPNNGATAP